MKTAKRVALALGSLLALALAGGAHMRPERPSPRAAVPAFPASAGGAHTGRTPSDAPAGSRGFASKAAS
jgi:hypothetical protein